MLSHSLPNIGDRKDLNRGRSKFVEGLETPLTDIALHLHPFTIHDSLCLRINVKVHVLLRFLFVEDNRGKRSNLDVSEDGRKMYQNLVRRERERERKSRVYFTQTKSSFCVQINGLNS